MQYTLLAPFLLGLAHQSAALSILLPLYIYPGASASAWNDVTATISAYPSVQWQIIINPNSGPGTTSYPDANYITGVSKLNSYANVQTVGYVDTAYTGRAYSAVTADIDAYAKWASYPSANISIAGIFFDDVNNTASNTVYTYMNNVAQYAYDNIHTPATSVIFNPGALAPTELFNDCDTIVEYEGLFSSYNGDTTINTIPSGYRNQSAIVVHDTPATADVTSLVQSMGRYGIDSVYFAPDCCYNQISAPLLKQLAAAVSTT